MALISVIGQVCGSVHWISDDKTELGMYVRNGSTQMRVIVGGPQIRELIANQRLCKGKAVTVYGDLSARCLVLKKETKAELTVEAFRVEIEEVRRSADNSNVLALVKAVSLWSDGVSQLKTFINHNEPGKPASVCCSIRLSNATPGMSDTCLENFKTAIRTGREFSMCSAVEPDFYNQGKKQVPVLKMRAMGFNLMG